MREEMQKANLPEPEFEILRGNFKVTFRKEIPDTSGRIPTQKTTQKITQKTILESLNETQLKILEIFRNLIIYTIKITGL